MRTNAAAKPANEPSLDSLPRVLVRVRGGVAEFSADPGVDVAVFDFDNVGAEAVPAGVPGRFWDLASTHGIPLLTATGVVDEVGSELERAVAALEFAAERLRGTLAKASPVESLVIYPLIERTASAGHQVANLVHARLSKE